MKSPRLDEDGSAALEVAVIAPLLLVVLLFVVGLGRLADARGQVQQAARDAARAASIARTPAAAQGAAQQAAADNLADRRISCARFAVDVDTAAFRPGGTVAVNVSCTVGFADVIAAGFPGTHTLAARSVSPLDAFRSVSP